MGGECGDTKKKMVFQNFIVSRPLPLDHADYIAMRTLCEDEAFPHVWKAQGPVPDLLV